MLNRIGKSESKATTATLVNELLNVSFDKRTQLLFRTFILQLQGKPIQTKPMAK